MRKSWRQDGFDWVGRQQQSRIVRERKERLMRFLSAISAMLPSALDQTPFGFTSFNTKSEGWRE